MAEFYMVVLLILPYGVDYKREIGSLPHRTENQTVP